MLPSVLLIDDQQETLNLYADFLQTVQARYIGTKAPRNSGTGFYREVDEQNKQATP